MVIAHNGKISCLFNSEYSHVFFSFHFDIVF